MVARCVVTTRSRLLVPDVANLSCSLLLPEFTHFAAEYACAAIYYVRWPRSCFQEPCPAARIKGGCLVQSNSEPGRGQAGSQRLLAIDLVRLLAMAMMIQGHTLDALLQPAYQAAHWYSRWQFIRGFTAPTFITLSGFTFALVTVRGWQQHFSFSSPVRRRLRRFGFFILLGYAMHFPVHRIADLQYLSAAGWQTALQVDVLQAIGTTLLLLQVLVFLTRTPKRFATVSLALSAAVVFLTPFMWNANWVSHLPLVFAAYLNGATGSLFPLFPWSAYALVGACIGAVYATGEWSSRWMARMVVLVGLVLAISGFQLQDWALRSMADFWHTSPTLFATRAGVVLLLLGAGLHFNHAPAHAAQLVPTLARESLLVYCFHVCLLYGSIWNTGLRQYWGGQLDLAHAAVTATVMIGSVLALAAIWDRCKRAGGVPVFAMRALVVAVAAWSLS